MRYRVGLTAEAKEQRSSLPPVPKRLVRRALRDMERDPYGPNTLRMRSNAPRYRVRAGDYRIIFEPGPGVREVSVIRIAHRDWVYEGFERPSADD